METCWDPRGNARRATPPDLSVTVRVENSPLHSCSRFSAVCVRRGRTAKMSPAPMGLQGNGSEDHGAQIVVQIFWRRERIANAWCWRARHSMGSTVSGDDQTFIFYEARHVAGWRSRAFLAFERT